MFPKCLNKLHIFFGWENEKKITWKSLSNLKQWQKNGEKCVRLQALQRGNGSFLTDSNNEIVAEINVCGLEIYLYFCLVRWQSISLIYVIDVLI